MKKNIKLSKVGGISLLIACFLFFYFPNEESSELVKNLKIILLVLAIILQVPATLDLIKHSKIKT